MWVGSSTDLERVLVALREVVDRLRDAEIARVWNEHDFSVRTSIPRCPERLLRACRDPKSVIVGLTPSPTSGRSR